MNKPMVVVGSINLDLVAGTQRIPVAGETVIGSSFQTFPGGKGANQAVAAARLGAEVVMIGKLGTDAFGRELKAALAQSGVNTEMIGFAEASSGVALIITDAQGNNSIAVVPGANAQLLSSDILAKADLIRAAGIVLAQLETPLESIEAVSEICAESSIPFILDPAPARALPDSLLQKVTWLTPNETETCSLLGYACQELNDDSLEVAARALLERGCQNVILKLGARGCYVALSDDTRRRLPSYAICAVDTTGAGDAFNGALALALLEGKDPLSAVQWASAVAAISVTRHGAQPSMPTLAEVEGFLEKEASSPCAATASPRLDSVSRKRFQTSLKFMF
jgi:ribokinase